MHQSSSLEWFLELNADMRQGQSSPGRYVVIDAARQEGAWAKVQTGLHLPPSYLLLMDINGHL